MEKCIVTQWTPSWCFSINASLLTGARIPFLDTSFWISLTVFELFCYCHFVIRQDHGYGSPRTNRRHLFATKTRCFCFSIRLQDNKINMHNIHGVTMKTSTWTAQLTVASSKAQHYLNSLCTTPKRPPSTRKFYVDFKKFFFKDQKIETHLLFLDVLRLVRHFFELKNSRVRSFCLPGGTHKR